MGCNNKKNTARERDILSSDCTSKKKSQTKTVTFGVLALPNSVPKERNSDKRHFSVVNIVCNFVDNVKLDVA